jgi:hypothetical protein
VTNAHSSGRGISENRLFENLHPNSQRYNLHKPVEAISRQMEEEEALKEWECQEADKTISGVVAMYCEDVNFGKQITWSFQLGNYVSRVNASYTYATRTFYFPRVRSGTQIIYTAGDQGIVSHEAGHMILGDLKVLGSTSHTGAFHEAFGDLTAHFYRFYNKNTRQQSIQMLENNEGCVGDNNFTCVRNNADPTTLGQVSCEVHELSKPFSSAVYNNMIGAFANRDANSVEGCVAGEIVGWHKRLLVNSVLSLNNSHPTLMDIAQKMLEVSLSDTQYRDGLGRNFIKNNLIVLMYKFPPTLGYPNPPVFYSPNGKFSTLCLVKQRPDTTRRALKELRT